MSAKLGLGLIALAAIGAGIFLSSDGERVGTPRSAGGPRGSLDVGSEGPSKFPSRILPASAASVDWLAGLGVDPKRVVALPVQADRYACTRLDPARWGSLPRYEVFASEVALGFEPDLVMISPITSAGAVAKIADSGVQIMTVEEPSTWPELVASGQSIAQALGMEADSQSLMESLDERRRSLLARPLKPLIVLPYANYGGGGSTSGVGTTLHLAIELAGFENAGAKAGFEGYSNLSHEQILVLEFDAILVMGETFETSDSAAQLVSADSLEGVVPVRDRRFIYVPEALYASGSHTILDAAEEVARQGDALTR